MPRSDLFARLGDFFQKAGVVGMSAIILILLILAVLALLNKRTALLYVCLASMMFSGAAPTVGVAEGAVLLRWIVMVLVALTAVQSATSPGLPLIMLGGMAVYGVITSPLSPSLGYSLQMGVLLFIVTVPFAAAVARHLRTLEDVHGLLRMYLAAAGLLVFLGLLKLPELVRADVDTVGHRLGGMTSTVVFVLQGGIMLPICLWGATQPRLHRWRTYCFVVALSIIVLSLISGTRTGTFAGFVGCLPLLSRVGFKKVFVGVGMIVLAALLFYALASLVPERSSRLLDRYVHNIVGGDYTTGRYRLWSMALGNCIQDPFIGHGLGTEITQGYISHNAYLKAWWELGLGGVLLFMGAYAIMGVQALRLMLSHYSQEIRDLGRVMFGVLLTLTSAGFFEGKLLSPSNVTIFTTALLGVMLVRTSTLVRQGAYSTGGLAGAGEGEYSYAVGEWGPSRA